MTNQVSGFVRCECGYYVEPCCVPGCNRPRLAVAPTCYGHTVDESDPRHISTGCNITPPETGSNVQRYDGSGGGE